jgi:hypothetical protein
MLVIKYFNGPGKLHIEQFVRVERDRRHRFFGHMLVNFPINKPYRARDGRWVPLNEVHIVWIRPFLEEYEEAEIHPGAARRDRRV